MTKYTVVDYFIRGGQLVTQQCTGLFDSIQEAERARVVILNENFGIKPQELRVVQYDFS